MQEPNFHIERRILTREHKTLSLHAPAFGALLRFAISFRRERPEIKALPILHSRWPVRVEHIALVEHGIGDLFDEFDVHVF